MLDVFIGGFFSALKIPPICWDNYLGERKVGFCPKLSCGGGMRGERGSLKNYVQMPGNAGSHRVPNTPDLQLISCCICYRHHCHSLAVALTGEGTQASTSF